MASQAATGTMPILSVGATSNRPAALTGGGRAQRGVTLIEMLIVVTLIALVAGISFPSAAAGIENLRLRSAGDAIVSFLNTAVDRADRRQQPVEILISPDENVLVARSADLGFIRRLEVPDPVRIIGVRNMALNVNQPVARRFLVYPGSAPPRILIEISVPQGRRRVIAMDPLSGFPRVVAAAE
jgi:prepilin-type N-terminal cleavage/methylation domain-containing protein